MPLTTIVYESILNSNMKTDETKKTPTRAFIWQLKKGQKFTTNIPLAIEIAKATGKKPADFISPKIREYVVSLNPSLGRKVSKKVSA